MITKICGIKNEDTLICCEDNNVDFFGIRFYPKSPRNISIEDASNLQKKSENLNINGVGVFVNKNINEIGFFAKGKPSIDFIDKNKNQLLKNTPFKHF